MRDNLVSIHEPEAGTYLIFKNDESGEIYELCVTVVPVNNEKRDFFLFVSF